MTEDTPATKPSIQFLLESLRRWAAKHGLWPPRFGLPAKLLVLTAIFVMVAEILIFLPSIASYRVGWLNDRITAAYLASLAADAAPNRRVPPALRGELLRTALVRAIALRRSGARRVVLPPVSPLNIAAHYDMRVIPRSTFFESFSQQLSDIRDAITVLTTGEDRTIRIIGLLGPRYDDVIEVVLEEEPLKRAMTQYGLNILWLSVLISLATAALVYFTISRLLVRPMMRLSQNIQHFGENPEDKSRIIVPSERGDEIGVAERELESMQRELSHFLLQRKRLAQLGLAVSKISHDLRNMLANAQLISDRLTSVPDPRVQQFAPKLIASLDRAINFCNDSLKFGRGQESEPRREIIKLKPLLGEVADGLGIPRDGQIAWVLDVDDDVTVDADHEHLFRILSNLASNAVQAIESQGEEASGEIKVKARREDARVSIWVCDDGPGVPPAARENLFKAFQGSRRKGGTGLGLVIAAELVAAHGGTLELVETEKGAIFLIELPDRLAS